MENNIFYNYIYLDPRKPGNYTYGIYHFDYEPFYVGKGSNRRYKKKHKNCEKLQKEIISDGFDVIYKFMYENLSENIALSNETQLIQLIGRKDKGLGPLLNKQDRSSGNSGISEEARQKISKTHKGKKHTEEHKKKISESLKGEKNNFYGKHHTEEARQKISKSRNGMKHTEETKRKIREAISGENHPFYGKKRTEETKRKISESRKGKYSGKNNHNYGKQRLPETRQKISETLKGKNVQKSIKEK